MKITQLSRHALLSLTALLAMTTVPKALTNHLAPLPAVARESSSRLKSSSVLTAQATTAPAAAPSESVPTFTLPATVAADTKLSIDGSSSMEGINAALKQGFETKYSGSSVTIASGGTDAALEALKAGKVDLAAIGRPLTAEEKSAGLVAVPITRHKIAMMVSADNPFQGSLTIEQFAKIFRGEITNWKEVGGPDAPIKLIDRPESSDTRRAFQNYPVFQKAPFKAGSTAEAVEDQTSAVAAKLGQDGLGYAIAEQAFEQPGAKVVKMHNTLPTDLKYPFSQPLLYVYKGPTASEAVKAFLGYATASENKQLIETARAASATPAASPAPTVAESPAATESPAAAPSPAETATVAPATTGESGGFPWWLLLLPLLALPFLFLRGRKEGAVVAPVEPPKPVPPAPVPPAPVPTAAPVAPVPAAAPVQPSEIILTPRDCRDAYAYWELSNADRNLLHQVGNRPKVRLYEVTDIPNMDLQAPHSMKEFDIDPQDQDQHLPIAIDNKDYLVEVGYTSNDGRWNKLARSAHVRVPACPPATPAPLGGLRTGIGDLGSAVTGAVSGAASGVAGAASGTASNVVGMAAGAAGLAAGAAAGAAAIGTGMAAKAGESLFGDDGLFGGLFGDDKPTTTGPAETLILVPRNAHDAYAYWEVPEAEKAAARQQGGKNLKLRLYDVTDINLDTQPAHSVYEYDCSETEPDLHLPIYKSDRDYLVELGYTTDDGRWLKIARSKSVRVPAG